MKEFWTTFWQCEEINDSINHLRFLAGIISYFC